MGNQYFPPGYRAPETIDANPPTVMDLAARTPVELQLPACDDALATYYQRDMIVIRVFAPLTDEARALAIHYLTHCP